MLISKAKRSISWENLVVLFAIALPLGRGLFNTSFGLLMGYWLYSVIKGRVDFNKRDLIFLAVVCSFYLYSIIHRDSCSG